MTAGHHFRNEGSGRARIGLPARRQGLRLGRMSGRWLILSLLCVCLGLGACGRRLTAPETDLAARLFGPGLDVTPVRLSETGLVGLRQAAGTLGESTASAETPSLASRPRLGKDKR